MYLSESMTLFINFTIHDHLKNVTLMYMEACLYF